MPRYVRRRSSWATSIRFHPTMQSPSGSQSEDHSSYLPDFSICMSSSALPSARVRSNSTCSPVPTSRRMTHRFADPTPDFVGVTSSVVGSPCAMTISLLSPQNTGR